MARKSAALLSSQPVKLRPTAKAFIAQIKKIVPVEGCEVEWERYVKAAIAHEEACERHNLLYLQVEKEGGSSSCKSWPAYLVAGKVMRQATQVAFGALDTYQSKVKHKDDKQGVPEEEVRAIVIESLQDKLDGLTFNINSGMLGSKIAQAIRSQTAEESVGDFYICEDCQA